MLAGYLTPPAVDQHPAPGADQDSVGRVSLPVGEEDGTGGGIEFRLAFAYCWYLKVLTTFTMTALKRRPVAVGREMSITKEKKSELIGSFKRGDHDTGSPEVQIALLTARINDLTDHFKTHAKDHASRRGLLMMVSKRSGLLKYLRLHDRKKYLDVISRLGIRK